MASSSISRSDLQIIEFDIHVNGQLLNHYKADGMIVTTPTGSTGYNLSAGGPLVEPKAKLITLTPICPHSLNQRSIILSPEDEIVIEIPGGREGQKPQLWKPIIGGSPQSYHVYRRTASVLCSRRISTEFIPAESGKLPGCIALGKNERFLTNCCEKGMAQLQETSADVE